MTYDPMSLPELLRVAARELPDVNRALHFIEGARKLLPMPEYRMSQPPDFPLDVVVALLKQHADDLEGKGEDEQTTPEQALPFVSAAHAWLERVRPTLPLSDAYISPDGKHRFRLRRMWDQSLPNAVFIMLNPSTANASADDPTIKRCIKFARRWGCGGIVVVNLFAYRASKPKALLSLTPEEAVGREDEYSTNINYVLYECQMGRKPGEPMEGLGPRVKLAVAAWGNHGHLHEQDRRVLDELAMFGIPLHCLGKTKDGFPKHPLARGKSRIPDDFEPQRFT